MDFSCTVSGAKQGMRKRSFSAIMFKCFNLVFHQKEKFPSGPGFLLSLFLFQGALDLK